MSQNIFDYIKSQENYYETQEITLADNWQWNMRDHIQLITHLKNGVFYTGDNDYLRAFKNIMEPILELAYWTEDLEVKDVTFFIESNNGKVLSFLVKKYHDEVYVKEHNLDTLFDEITESDIDYGGVLVQRTGECAEVIPLQSIAFCDQTNMDGGAKGFKYNFTPSQLRNMKEYGWGEEKNGASMTLNELCLIVDNQKEIAGSKGKKDETTSKTIEVYIVRGDLPESYLKDDGDPEKTVKQVQIVAFYTDKDNNKQGVYLYRKEEVEDALKFFTSKKVYNRALGRGIGERLIQPQIWTNFLEIHKHQMLENGAKNILYTDDESYTDKNKIQEMENNEVTTVSEGKRIAQIPTINTANIQLYTNEINQWYQYSQNAGSAQDPLLGKEASSGTTFRGQERLVAQGKGSHDKRRGQRAKFIEELYRDWFIDDIKKEILKGKKFLATLTSDELSWVAESIATNKSNKKIIDTLLNTPIGKLTQEKIETLKQLPTLLKNEAMSGGNQFLIEILKKDFEDVNIKMGINIAGKQKNLVELSDKLLSIFQFIFANPQGFQQAMQNPALSKAFENILEFGGMSIGDFSSLIHKQAMNVEQLATQAQQTGKLPGNLLPEEPVTA